MAQFYGAKTLLSIICSVTLSTFCFGQVLSNDSFYEWIVQQHQQNPDLNTNQIIRSAEFERFLDDNISNKESIYLGMSKATVRKDLNYHILEVLGGPPDQIKFHPNGTITITGCRYRSCPEKGFIWIDTKQDKQVFAIISYFFNSKVFHPNGILVIHSDDFGSKEELLIKFWENLDTWLNTEKIKNYETRLIN